MIDKNCKLCDNCIRRKNVVSGYGNINSSLIFVFDHPRYKQDKTGKFDSDEGIKQFLNILSSFGYTKENSYFTYLVKCRPVSGADFVKGLDICTTTYLSKEYKHNQIKKKVMVTVGKQASNFILGDDKYRYFHPYKTDSIIIPIPSTTFFLKAGKTATKKLTIIQGMLRY